MAFGKGKNNPRWNGGKTTASNGLYVVVCQPHHPRADSHGYVREHHLVMEKYLGRFLLPTEEVHHINGDKRDNKIENLQLVFSRSVHLKMEHKLGTYKNHLGKLNVVGKSKKWRDNIGKGLKRAYDTGKRNRKGAFLI
jgi:hypothetical protein